MSRCTLAGSSVRDVRLSAINSYGRRTAVGRKPPPQKIYELRVAEREFGADLENLPRLRDQGASQTRLALRGHRPAW